jgi:mycofactocin system creatininase family protein
VTPTSNAARRLSTSTSPDLAAQESVLLVPLGSTEQHGPHLPLDTDTRIAEVVAARVAALHPRACVAPALAYGASGEHAGFAGTLSIGQAALELVVVELVRSAGPEWAAIVLVNGHGGNVEALSRAAATLQHEGRPVTVWSPRLEGADTHAGHAETSLLLALDPACVHLERAEVGNTQPLADLLPELRESGLRAVTPNGILGDPTGADAETGQRLLDDLVASLDGVVATVLEARGVLEHEPAMQP